MKSLTLMFLCLLEVVHGQMRPAAVAESSGSNLPIQRIGMNDLVAISVYDAAEFSRTVRVDAEGFIRLPMLKRPIKAAGLMPAELESAVSEALQAAELIVGPFVTVSVSEHSSQPINVMGAVRDRLRSRQSAP
jgi:protein involved in polysaccharide export with SLBB domain